MRWRFGLLAALTLGACLPAATPAGAATTVYNYTYSGPAFAGNSGNISVTLSLTSLLKVSTVYSGLPAGTVSATIKVTSPTAAGNFSLPVQTFAISTDAGGRITDWAIAADANNLGKQVPSEGSDHFASTVNTLSQSAALPRPGLSRIASDQASVTIYYESCAGILWCKVSNGQPYVAVFNGAVSNATGSWTVTKSTAGGGCGSSGSGGCGGGGGGGGD